MNRIAAFLLGLSCLVASTNLVGCSGDEDTGSAATEGDSGSDGGDVQADTTEPAITLIGSASIEVAFASVFRDLGAEATDDTDGVVAVDRSGSIDTSVSGTYTLTYTASDTSGNTSSVDRSVVVLEDRSLTSSVSVPIGPASAFFDGELIGADYWDHEPKILSAGMGFADIVGVDTPQLSLDVVRDAAGGWSQDIDCGSDTRNYTATSTQDQVGLGYIQRTPYGELKDGALGLDGLPIVFSWPVDTSTLSLTDFQFTLNTGDIVRPLAVSPFPNVENNERNTVVVFAEWGNRLPSSDPGSRFPIKLEIVEDDTPLLLVGPGNRSVSAVGLTWETSTTPYDENNGPGLVGAKLNRLSRPMPGEGVSVAVPAPTNDASALYDEGDFVIRMLTSGGFSPDGASGVKPDEFERFFRIHATGVNGETVILDTVGQTYDVQGGSLRVVGLADLGQPEGGDVVYDECYDEDVDNYIDVILVGDEAAARNVTHLETPSLAGGYSPFYSPGGPSRTPFEGVTYTQPGPADLEPVLIALDDPMRVTYRPGEDTSSASPQRLTLEVDGTAREYLLTVPAEYSDDTAVPLLFNFHGLGGTAQQQYDQSEFDAIAQRENFIVVTPQAIEGVWTVTAFPVSRGADDFGFIAALIDQVSESYNVDGNRIYATGMSQGGFLSFDLACNLSTTFAAIAPVSAGMAPALVESCMPSRLVPVLQTHGTEDDLVGYDTGQSAIQWWVDFNMTDATPSVTELPDPFPTNGTTVERFVYSNGEAGSSVEHLRINGGGHSWPGSDGNSDIDFAEEVWSFLSRYGLDGPLTD